VRRGSARTTQPTVAEVDRDQGHAGREQGCGDHDGNHRPARVPVTRGEECHGHDGDACKNACVADPSRYPGTCGRPLVPRCVGHSGLYPFGRPDKTCSTGIDFRRSVIRIIDRPARNSANRGCRIAGRQREATPRADRKGPRSGGIRNAAPVIRKSCSISEPWPQLPSRWKLCRGSERPKRSPGALARTTGTSPAARYAR